MDVQEEAGLNEDTRLKLNSYDLGVDIELADCIQRLRFERPDVKTVVVTGGKERIFVRVPISPCSGRVPTLSR